MSAWDIVASRIVQSDCWIWTGAKTPTGYGQFPLAGRRVYAHRVSFEHHHRKLLDGECVLHTCDNPSCVNPRHLRAGTQRENMKDMDSKGRRVKPDDHGMRKLTRDQVERIRVLYASGKWLQRELADMFGVQRPHISRLCSPKSKLWRNLEDSDYCADLGA